MSRKKWEMPKGSGRSASGFGKPLAIGIGISMALTLGLSAFFATLMDRQMLGQEMTGALAIGILAVSVAAGAWSAAKPMVICLLVGGGDLLMLFAATAFFFGGKYQGIPVTAALVLGTCAVAGIAGAGVGKRHKRIPKKYRIG
jgi:hypothetical protein